MRWSGIHNCFFTALCLFIFLFPENSSAQKIITGKIRDRHSDEPVPFASLRLRSSGVGQSADSSGGFSLYVSEKRIDTLDVTSVGYQDYSVPINFSAIKGDSLKLLIHMVPGKITGEVVIKSKVNRGLIMWRRIVAHKPYNDRYRFKNFSYELYNKLELDLKNVNKEKLQKIRLLRPFDFVLNDIDTTEGTTYLPSYLTEAISDYYYQKNPERRREVFKGVKTIGVSNESISKLLGGMDQNIDFYNNFIPVFDKQFVSPISDNGDQYYNYKVADTQYVGGRRLVHFLFSPKRKGQNTFEGDCWVHDTTFAIQKMNLRLGKEANINFVDRLSLIQEYQLVNDSIWFLSKDKFVVDLSPIGKNSISFIGRKTTTYRNVVINDSSVIKEVAKNKHVEDIILPPDASKKSDDYWVHARHEELEPREKQIYHMMDTLLHTPQFKAYTKAINFIGTGYYSVGYVTLGPWYNWTYEDIVEGWRVRWDMATSSKLSKNFTIHEYTAYGFGDHKWKGDVDGLFFLKKHPRMYIYAEYLNDFDYDQNYLGDMSSDNIFAYLVRKSGVPIKYLKLEQSTLELFKEWNSGFSIDFNAQHKQYDPVRNLPAKELYPGNLNSFETSVQFRFAYLEKFLENTYYRTSLGSDYPIVAVKFTKGIPGVLGSSYNYWKVSGSVSDNLDVSPYGKFSFNAFAGKTFGTLPYLFLDIAPGNEMYYYNKYSFNLMNKYEFIHDQYAGISVEHHFGSGLFRYIPITRKLKFRQFWTAKALWGSLTDANYALNAGSGLNFQSLNGKTYLELGTGVDNILKVLRVDFLWRPFPLRTSTPASQHFGVFGSLSVNF